ncbi:MAG TPA: hypothetical protein VF151_10810 [Gemmatimonadales bacterium]
MGALDEYIERLTNLPAPQRKRAVQDAIEATKDLLWIPNPGPQTEAFFSEADELLYGGEAGGGKSDLGIGLSLTAHRRSLVLRRTNKEAEKLFERYAEIIGNEDGKNAAKGWRLPGRVIDIGGCQLERDKQKRKGIPHDLKFFDELVDFTESQYIFITTWVRSTDPEQRTRIVATTNPPTTPEGMWVVRRWAPWLDPTHPRPAKSGELRWFTNVNGVDTEVEGRGPHKIDGRLVYAKSRTFIRSKLEDNPDLMRTGDYQATLDALPKELQEAYARGKFDSQLKDQPLQAIPTAWIRAAMERWTERPPGGVPMCGMGVDCTGGGTDPMMIAIRYDNWFDKMIEIPAAEIPKDRVAAYSAGIVLSYRRDKAVVVVDMGGGYGQGVYEWLKDNDVDVVAHKGAEGTPQRTREGQLRFYNKRTMLYWRFREALDPSQPGGSVVALPPDPLLLADLATPTFGLARVEGQQAVQLEPKEDVVERLARSTDRGDSVVQAWSAGPTFLTAGEDWDKTARGGANRARLPRVVMGRGPSRRRR